jgi:hypothetical protein
MRQSESLPSSRRPPGWLPGSDARSVILSDAAMPRLRSRTAAARAHGRVAQMPATSAPLLGGSTQAKSAAAAAAPAAAPPLVWGEYVSHAHCSAKNVGNALLCLCALAPSFAAAALLYRECDPSLADSAQAVLRGGGGGGGSDANGNGGTLHWDSWDGTCALVMRWPLLLSNALFFANITVGFWVVGLLQRSFWLIDPYWTLVPPLLGHLYRAHPLARYNEWRSGCCLVLLWGWSIRLTYSYFRREGWKFGEREDWRYHLCVIRTATGIILM